MVIFSDPHTAKSFKPFWNVHRCEHDVNMENFLIPTSQIYSRTRAILWFSNHLLWTPVLLYLALSGTAGHTCYSRCLSSHIAHQVWVRNWKNKSNPTGKISLVMTLFPHLQHTFHTFSILKKASEWSMIRIYSVLFSAVFQTFPDLCRNP